jgi:superfamily II DNA or RNA helicase
MWLQVENLHTKVVNATDDERTWVSEYLSFEDPTAVYRHLGKNDGRARMFNPFACSFPSGFVPMVRKAAVAEGYQVQVLDKRVVPCPPEPAPDLGWLRDYQHEAMAACIRERRGIIWAPTGSGKTEIPVALVLTFPVRWLFLVHRTTLVDQTISRYAQRTLGERAGRVGDGVWDVRDDDLLVCATFQTLANALEAGDPRATALMESAMGVVVDECHTLPAATFYRVVMASANAFWRFGLSGTPLARGDKRSVLAVAALGPIIYRLRTDRLIEEGVLAKPTIRMIDVKQSCDLPTYQGVYGAAIVRSATRNRVVVECARRAEKPTLVFVKEITHGHILRRELERAGLNTGFVWGNSFHEQRKRAIRDLSSGRLDVLVCSVVFQEGVDIPELRSVIVATGGKSIIAALQRIGRGMRRADGKTTFEVWDIADPGCGCARKEGHSGCRWLKAHTAARLRAYTSEGHSVVREQPLLMPPPTKRSIERAT